MIKTELAGMLIKPDTHERGIYASLKSDILGYGFELLLEEDIVLDSKDVTLLYPKECRLPPAKIALTEYLAGKRTTLWLLKLKDRPDVNATKYLQSIKGDTQKTYGLRAKYNIMSITPGDAINKTSAYFRFLMINNFHVFDDFEICIGFIKRKTNNQTITF